MKNWNEYKYSEIPDWFKLGKILEKLGHLPPRPIKTKPLSNIHSIEEALKNLGIRRFKIVHIDSRNVDIYIPNKNQYGINIIISTFGVPGVKYKIKELPLWKFRFNKG